MTRVRRRVAIVARFVVPALAAVAPLASRMDAQLAIRDVTVIDGTGAAPRPHQTVLVLRDRIAAVGDAGSVAIPPRTRIIDGRGKFLLPGFIDVHAHTSIGPTALDTSARPPRMTAREDVAASREALRVLLAFGITTIRDPGGPTASTVALRDSLRLGLVTGPHMVTAGSIIDLSEAPGMVVTVRTESELRAEVARQAAAGVDYVKLYASLPAPLVRAGIDEAHKRGVRAIAHLFGTSWTEAATAGIDGIVHITPGSPALLTDEARPRFMQRFRGTQFMLEWFSFADLQSPQIREMTAALVAHQVFLDPTLVIFESLAWGDSARILDGRDLAYAAPSIVTAWRRFSLTAGWKAEDFAAARAAWPQVMAFTRHLYEAGVPLSAGTDIGNPFIVPGASFHRELQLLADAGIPPLEVLRIATRGGARSLGLESEVGRVAPGALADLVLLDADPVADIRHTRRISLVVQRGTASTPAQLLPPRLRARGLAP
jgi:imidazolonepropionase-like amidohydrolase